MKNKNLQHKDYLHIFYIHRKICIETSKSIRHYYITLYYYTRTFFEDYCISKSVLNFEKILCF